MKRWIVLTRWTEIAGAIPESGVEGWEVAKPGRFKSGLMTEDQAMNYAETFPDNFQEGYLEAIAVEIELPDEYPRASKK